MSLVCSIMIAFVWIFGGIAIWKWVLLPIALEKVSVGDSALVVFGVFWAIGVMIVAFYFILTGFLNERTND